MGRMGGLCGRQQVVYAPQPRYSAYGRPNVLVEERYGAGFGGPHVLIEDRIGGDFERFGRGEVIIENFGGPFGGGREVIIEDFGGPFGGQEVIIEDRYGGGFGGW